MKNGLFAYLKDRHIFTGGHKTLSESLSAMENKQVHENSRRSGIRAKGNRKRNTRLTNH